MREIKCVQGSPGWLALRAGLPTASEFHRIVTPLGRLSKQARDYKAFLLAERTLKAPITKRVSLSMERGTEFEQAAADFFAFTSSAQSVRKVGLIVNDAGTIGASPDRLVDEDGLLEVKIPEPENHMAYYLAADAVRQCEEEIGALKASPKETDYLKALQLRYEEAQKQTLLSEHRVQVCGQLWIVEPVVICTLMAFSPEGLPPVLHRVTRNEEKSFIEILAKSVTEFSVELERESANLVRSGVISAE